VFFIFQIGKEKKITEAGDIVLVPKEVPHKFTIITDDKVKFRITFAPGHLQNGKLY
jgi:quercetin dioxygenase-like cupin family protein